MALAGPEESGSRAPPSMTLTTPVVARRRSRPPCRGSGSSPVSEASASRELTPGACHGPSENLACVTALALSELGRRRARQPRPHLEGKSPGARAGEAERGRAARLTQAWEHPLLCLPGHGRCPGLGLWGQPTPPHAFCVPSAA